MAKELTSEQMNAIFGPDTEAPVVAAPVEEKVEKNTVEDVKQDDTPVEDPKAVTEEATDEVVDSDLERAWSALERDGWSKADLKRMSVDRIKELGAKRAKNHDDIDAAYRDLKSLKEAAKKAEKPKEPVLDRAAESQGDISEALAAFETEFGPEGKKAFEAALKPLLNKLTAVEKAEAERQQATAQSERIRLQKAFEGMYPSIAKPAVWDAVLVVAQQKADEGASSADDAVKAALSELYGDPVIAPKAEPKRATRVKDIPEAPSRSGAPKPISKVERELKALEIIESGGSLDDARKVLSN